MLAGLIDDQSHVSGDQPESNTAPATPDRQGPHDSSLNSNDASSCTSPPQSPATPQQSSPRNLGRDGLLSPPLDKALGMNPEEIDHYRGLTLKAWEASDSPAAAAASEHAVNHSDSRRNGSTPRAVGTRRDSITRGGDDRSRSRSNTRRPTPFMTGLKAAVAVAVLAAIAGHLLGDSTWLRRVERFATSREGLMHSGALQTPTEPAAISETESLTAATADAVEEIIKIDREVNEPAQSTPIEQMKREKEEKNKEAEDAVLQCSFKGLAGLYLHTDWPSLQPQAPSHLVSVPLVMAMVNSVRDAQDRLRPQFTELCGQIHAQNSVQQAESEGPSNSSSSNSGLDGDLTRTFGPEACTEDLLAQLDEWIRRNCPSNLAPGDGEGIV